MAVTYTIQGRLDQSLQRCQMQKKQSKNLQGIHTTMAKEKAHKIPSDSGN